jgi:hypothetical protein
MRRTIPHFEAVLVILLAPLVVVVAAQKSIKLPNDHPAAQLKPGPNVEIVRANCLACHSTDYIVFQPRSDAKHWEAEVKRMITVFGAPIREVDANAIVEYLAFAYGPQARSAPAAGTSEPGESDHTQETRPRKKARAVRRMPLWLP